MRFNPFQIAALPQILFGSGQIQRLPELILGYGQRLLLVTGSQSLRQRQQWHTLTRELKEAGIHWDEVRVSGEPSPQLIDATVSEYHAAGIQVVVAIGGGSVMDAAKAIAGLLPFGNSVLDHLEGVGRNIPYAGPALPYIAVPTTAGTGSEATKNAVLSQHGLGGYKKSFRHDTLIAKVALVDPDLLCSCPAELIAANAMDALTQLIESYVSIRANPLTDALALSGIEAIRDGLFDAWRGGSAEPAEQGRAALMYAALLSGITLAQAGLGSVHGLASPLGAYSPIPHGVACGTLLATATEINIEAMQAREPHNIALRKYAEIGNLLLKQPLQADPEAARQNLLSRLREWVEHLNIPRLGHYDITAEQLPLIVANSRGSSMQTNPIVLDDAEIDAILRQRL